MKSVIMLVAAAALLVSPVAVQNANAQLELTLGAGLNTPLGEYGDQANLGYSLTTGLGYRVMHLLSLGAELNYNGNKASDEVMATVDPDFDMSSSILQYAAVAKLMMPMGNHNVFAKGSVGSYRAAAKVTGPGYEAKFSTTELGYGLGAGFLINTDKNSSFFVDVTWHHIAYSDASFSTNYFTYNLGAQITFDLFKTSMRDKVQDDLDKLND